MRTTLPSAGTHAILEMGLRQNPVFQRTPAPKADIVGLLPTFVERAAPLASTLVPGIVVVSMVVTVVIPMVVTVVIPIVVTVVILSTMRILGPTALCAGVTAAAP
jgi:hypothetical protein